MLSILSVGIAPAIALLSYIYLKDKITEPIRLIIRMFILGALLVLPIMFIQYAISSEFNYNSIFVEAFFQIALLEEFFKWFVFMFVMYQHEEFDNHYDGIVYASSLSLGFASIENILYLITNGIEYAFMRAIFPVSSHALFGIIMGYYLGKAKTHPDNKNRNLTLAFLIPFLLHGAYNFILKGFSSFILILTPFMVICWIFALYRLKRANENTLTN
ncbi:MULTISPECIES: glutamic-type intramembrane protease PrsW [Oceanobacillus]|uniref:Protease PrsW n=1 Tax=Oceanobacillus kimchii TaxID=746691 RepID=A0ABQ5TPE3_9BACI|nr:MULTISPECIES: glutamic-type intramembrane protease PrsW [Oceanobacillus]MBT2598441.1 intramembrane metalloprotease PrsW [Oceanobacillus sp. ISL-74]MBT2651359.1 intramembrane metalloprotease PrsW [Oceanobacillus sp. ISL-73]OEH55755.1 peptidase [Oceanobacillus sp. E9]GLO66462.1 protease PrsW [Oceanobacillus kimchii]